MKYKKSIQELQPAFDNAHAHVISAYHDLDHDKMRRHFETEHGVKVIFDPEFGHWVELVFPNEEAVTMFVLKWS